MNFRHKVFAPLLLASISLSALSACGGDDFADGSECEPSGDAGSLTVYSGRGEYLVGDLLQQYASSLLRMQEHLVQLTRPVCVFLHHRKS